MLFYKFVCVIRYYINFQFGDDIFETASSTGRLGNVYDSLRPGNTTTLIEGLQAQLKMRDGKLYFVLCVLYLQFVCNFQIHFVNFISLLRLFII